MERMTNITALALTSGNAGHEVQCLGVIERLGLTPMIKHVSKTWLAPYGTPRLDASFFPLPDLVVAAGRLSIPFARAIKKAKPSCIVVIMQDPRCSVKPFDLVWVNEHDKLRGANVISTLTSPHRLTLEKLETEARKLPPLPSPTFGVIIGGASNIHSFNEEDAAILAEKLKALNKPLYITPSRRTGEQQIKVMQEILKGTPHFMWDMKTGENPYFGILGKADTLIVTSDSTNMLSEAAFTGKPLYAYKMKGSHKKFDAFHHSLLEKGIMRWFEGSLEHFTYAPLDSTGEIVQKIKEIMDK
jgi:hypothetical protein